MSANIMNNNSECQGLKIFVIRIVPTDAEPSVMKENSKINEIKLWAAHEADVPSIKILTKIKVDDAPFRMIFMRLE